MRLTRFASIVLLAGSLAAPGCSDPPAPVYEFPVEHVKKERIAVDQPPPASALLDVDELRATLGRTVPAGWTIEDPSDQIEAPDGWERIEGSRGIAVRIVDHRPKSANSPDPYFVLYLFPRGWVGRDIAQGIAIADDKLEKLARARPECASTDDPVAFYGANQDWLFFHTTKGFASSDSTVAAGWTRPQDDVARALRIEKH